MKQHDKKNPNEKLQLFFSQKNSNNKQKELDAILLELLHCLEPTFNRFVCLFSLCCLAVHLPNNSGKLRRIFLKKINYK